MNDGTEISSSTIYKFCSVDCGNYLLDLLNRIAKDCPGASPNNVSLCMYVCYSIVKYIASTVKYGIIIHYSQYSKVYGIIIVKYRIQYIV